MDTPKKDVLMALSIQNKAQSKPLDYQLSKAYTYSNNSGAIRAWESGNITQICAQFSNSKGIHLSESW